MDRDYKLIGGQASGGNDDVFHKKAGKARLGDFSGTGFLVVDPADPFKRRYGHVRIGVEAVDPISLARPRDGEHARWTYHGPVYRDQKCVIEELEVLVIGYSFSGGGVRVSVDEVPPSKPVSAG